MPKWCPATIVDKKVWTEGLFTIYLCAPDVAPFEPGQFLQLAVNDSQQRINRPYSVASPHGEVLEFFIVLVDDGMLTPRLWKLEKDHQIEISQRAAGSFTLKKSPESEVIWLISTGTGLAPYIAMLRTEEIWSRYQKICIVHGARHYNDLAYTSEINSYRDRHGDRICLIQALTREEHPETLQGRIPALLDSGKLEEIAGVPLQADNSTVMLCGNPAMLDDMEEKLGQRGMTRHRTKSPGQIVLERYW